MDVTLESRIRNRAYAIWEAEGQPHGEDLRHWEMAQQEFLAAAPKAKAARAPRKPAAAEAAATPAKPVKAAAAAKPAPAAAAVARKPATAAKARTTKATPVEA